MSRGFYTAASGMIAGLSQQEALIQNLSNMRTVGYKADEVTAKDFPSLLLVQVRGTKTVSKVGELGTGVAMANLTTNFDAGPLRLTDHPLDFAVAGDGFFQLQTENGVRYTRDGRFHADGDGRLVSADGYPVQGENGDIIIPPGDLAVSASGAIFANDEQIGQLSMAKFDDLGVLTKENKNLFSAPDGAARTMDATEIQVHQGYLEDSNVDVTKMITEMTSVLRAYQLSQHMVQVQDRINGHAANEIGRV